MDTEKNELWHQLSNESERAYRAFQTFLSLPSNDRTVIGAYRSHVGNPTAAKVSDTWAKWSHDFAWAERANAYDAYLESLRQEAYERAIQEEAAQQAREVEKARGRSNELLTLGYVRAIEWFEEMDASQMRMSDVIHVARLHMDYLKAFPVQPEPRHEDDWTEEDEAQMADLIKEIDAQAEDDEHGEGEDGEGEDDSEDIDSDQD